MQYNFYIDPVTRRVTSEHMVVLWQDQNVTTIHFSLEDADGLSFVGASILIKAILPGGIPVEITPENFAVETNTTKDDEGNDVVIGYTTTFDWTLNLEHTQKVGQISYSVCAILLDHTGEVIDKEWHTLNDSFAVLDHIHFDGSDDYDDPETAATNAEKIAALLYTVAAMASKVDGMVSGAPEPAETAADMTEHDKLYVYIGTQTQDLTPGYWYFWDTVNEEWTAGLEYGSMTVDTALNADSTNAIQNKVVYQAVADLNTAIGSVAADLAAGLASGAITKAQLAAAVQASLDKADTAMQPAVYDTLGRGVDVYQYAKGQVDDFKDNYYTPLSMSIQDALHITSDDVDVQYTTLQRALIGVYDLSKAYVRARLVDYRAFTITVVDELPAAGQPMTFYLLPKESGNGYDKYWWIVDENDEPKWDVFGSSSTLIVEALPLVGDEAVDYILTTSSGCLYYKYFDDEWHMVAGSLAETVDELPQVGNEYTDYYVENESGIYVHYRWIDSAWEMIGADGYTKAEVDALLSTINGNISTLTDGLATANTNLNSLSRTVDRIAQSIEEMGGDGLSYYAELSQEGDVYTYTLYEVDGTDETVKSQFVLPSGGGGGQSSTTTLTVEKVTASPIVCTPTDSVVIQIRYSSVDSDNEEVDGSYVWKLGNTIIATGLLTQGLNTFDLTEHCSIGSQKLTLTVTDEGGSVAVKAWNVQIVDVRLESSFSDRYTNPVGQAVNFTYTPYGAITKTVHFKLDGVELQSVSTGASGTLQSYTIPTQTHGAHLLEVWITATVNGNNIETDHIFKDIIWYNENSQVPVIGCPYRYDHYGQIRAKQYNTTRITYIVYDPSTTSPEVSLSVDGHVVNTLELSEAVNTWAFKSSDIGVHSLTITCGITSVEIRVNVVELGYDVSPVTANLEFDFEPSGRSNADVNRLWSDTNNPSIAMTVSSNFDWVSGGYQVDSEDNQYFCVKAGSRAYISYDLFGTNPIQAGAEFKVIFKVTNVRDNTTSWLKCIPAADQVKVGLDMKAHAAYLKTSVDELYTPYSEEDVIEYEYNINTLDTEDPNATSYIMSYEDGVGARPLIYDSSHRLYQYTPAPITIGSDDCDVWIYRMKAYSSSLTDSDILRNFIADAREAETMIARYERNQIYDENNSLTPESVAAACPDLRVIMIDCPHFTNDKKDYVKNTNVRCIYKNGDPVYDNWQWTNGYHAGQGTTSNEYGFAGRNIDIIFGFDGEHQRVSKIPLDASYISELVLGDGTRYSDGSGKVSLTRQSVPNDWFNLKVNIASSENANNALLQKRYNTYIPYKTPGQKKNPYRKNSMEFQNCVIFIRENDPDLSTHREFQDNAWHFYAIGNIGDSKKTDNTRVTDPTDLAEFVVEVSDNTLPNSWFQTGVYLDANDDITYDPEEAVSMVYPITTAQWENQNNLKRQSLYEDWDDSFEFRYDMGTKDGETISSAQIEAQQELSKQVWRDMYEWVVTSSDVDFVAELGDWFIVESPLYWYLFTERYTMIDNRAKNSFWHWGKTYITEAEAVELGDDAQYYTVDNAAAAINDGYRFDLWDYDNDTALGINNSGELTMTYGKEDVDYKTDGDASSGFIFNAAQSVFWCRIRDLMFSQLQNMYRDRESAGCWSAESLIIQWDTWQEQFPEELWRLDIQRKYLRTYQAGTVRFLNEMMNGRKRYQRRQFERDQEVYIGTKYVGTNIRADQIMFRCNTPSIAVVPPDYTLKLVPYSDMYLTVLYGNSPAPVQVRAKAGTEYTLRTNLTEMDDTAILIYAASRIQAINDLSACYIHDNDFSKASKLRTLIIGNTTQGYANTFLTTLNMGNNVLLETLDIRNCPNLTGSVNLSACQNLVSLYAEGTALTSVLFAANGKIALAHLPNTINNLTLRYIKNLVDLQMAFGNLEAFICEYSDVNALSIVQTAINSLQVIRLLGIDWTLTESTLLNQILSKSSSLLTGSVYISGLVRQRELNAYAAAWPDLEVTYDPNMLVQQYQVAFLNYDDTLLYVDYVDSGTLATDPVTAGHISAPTKPSDVGLVYTFSGWEGISSVVTADKSLKAQYSSATRYYTVRYLQGQTVLQTSQVAAYGTPSYTGADPSIADVPGSYTYYLWTGWGNEPSQVTADTDIIATFLRCDLPSEVKDLTDYDYAYSDDPEDSMAYTLGEFYAICHSGQASTYLSIGALVKMITDTSLVADPYLEFRLHSFGHYELAAGGMSHADFYMVGILPGRQMYATSTNLGGWDGSLMREWLNGSLYPALPSIWKAIIAPSITLADKGNSNDNILRSTDYLRIPSRAEAGWDTTNTPYMQEISGNAHEITFSCYTDNNSRIKKVYTGTATDWWLRSAHASTAAYFWYITTGGFSGYNQATASASKGVCVGFSV